MILTAVAVPPGTSVQSAFLHGATGLADELVLVGMAVVLGIVVLFLSRGGKEDDQ